MEVIQKVVEGEIKIRRDTETDQISENKISKYGRGEVRIMCKIYFFFFCFFKMSAIQIIGQLFILRWLAPFQSFQKRLLFAFHSPKIRKNDSNIIGRRLRTRYLSRRHYLDRLGFNDGLSRFLFICFNGDLLSRSLFRSGCWITGFCLLIKKNKSS